MLGSDPMQQEHRPRDSCTGAFAYFLPSATVCFAWKKRIVNADIIFKCSSVAGIQSVCPTDVWIYRILHKYSWNGIFFYFLVVFFFNFYSVMLVSAIQQESVIVIHISPPS